MAYSYRPFPDSDDEFEEMSLTEQLETILWYS